MLDQLNVVFNLGEHDIQKHIVFVKDTQALEESITKSIGKMVDSDLDPVK